MRIRRCSILLLEPREDASFDLASLLAGGDGLRRRARWLALAPHLGEEVEVDATERELLGLLSPTGWSDSRELGPSQQPALRRLLQRGLVIGASRAHAAHRERDERLRDTHWHPLAATLHAFTRWREVDAMRSLEESGLVTAQALCDGLGAPPPETAAREDALRRIALPRAMPTTFDALLARRATCRNFDTTRALPLPLFAQLLARVFGAQAQVRIGDDAVFVKKTSPSGGGLHCIEAYLLVQRVDGLAPGLYRYDPLAHGLDALAWQGDADGLPAFALHAVAGQAWFADAPALVLLAPRYARAFWKYRRHPKAWRVVALEAGHLSQTLYLAATEAGLGAFVTGAINEVALEQAFGLDSACEGVLAVCGFGWRASVQESPEFDPAGAVWETLPGA
jgi:putative peptide maturation dehydrogenase